MKCKQCGSTKFRTSHLRGSDVSRLFQLRYPVRCRACQERDYAAIPVAFGLFRAEQARHRERRLRKQNEGSAGQI